MCTRPCSPWSWGFDSPSLHDQVLRSCYAAEAESVSGQAHDLISEVLTGSKQYMMQGKLVTLITLQSLTAPDVVTETTGIILGMGLANQRRFYIVASSLIVWAHTQNNFWPIPCAACVCKFSVLSVFKHWSFNQDNPLCIQCLVTSHSDKVLSEVEVLICGVVLLLSSRLPEYRECRRCSWPDVFPCKQANYAFSCLMVGLDCICLTTTHVLKDILVVFHK